MLERNFDTPLPLELDVSIASGQVEVETVEGDESTVIVDGPEDVLEQVEIRQEGDRLVVAQRDKGKLFSLGSLFGNESLEVRARVPHGAGAKIKTASADIELGGHLVKLDVSTASGDVRVRGMVDELARVKTASGDVSVERVGGDVSVQTVSGDMRVGPVGGSVETRSVSGDIRLESLQAGEARFTSVSGDVEVGIAQGSLLDVDAGSTSGDLKSELELSGDPVGDGATVVLRGRTVSGDVRVFRAS